MNKFLGCEEIVVECNKHITAISWNDYFPFEVIRSIEMTFSTGAKWRVNLPASGISDSRQIVMLVEKYFGETGCEISQIKFVIKPEVLNSQLEKFLNYL